MALGVLAFLGDAMAACPDKSLFSNDVFKQLRDTDGSRDRKVRIGDKDWVVTNKSHSLPNAIEIRTKDKFRENATVIPMLAPGSEKCKYTFPVSRVQTAIVGGDEERWFEITSR